MSDPDLEKKFKELEKQVKANKQQLSFAKSAKAILILGVVLFMVFEVDTLLPGGGRLKSQRLKMQEATEIFLFGAWAVGSIALEDILKMRFKSSKLSEPDDTTVEHED